MRIQNQNSGQLTSANYRWRPAPIIYISLFVHVAVIILLFTPLLTWRWAIAIIVANHLILCFAVLFPKSKLLGPNDTSLPDHAKRRNEIAITFDDGPDPEITPQVLDILDRYNAKASFFCIGKKVVEFPEIAKEIIKRGHCIENHSYHHPLGFSFYGMSGLHKEVQTAQQEITRVTGYTPQYFRAPAGFRSPMLDPIMAKNQLRYVSWTRRALDGVKANIEGARARLLRNFSAGDILLLHDGTKARTSYGESVVLTVLPTILEAAAAKNLKVVSLTKAFKE